jgi:hypothetical protein
MSLLLKRQEVNFSFPGVVWALIWTSFEYTQAAHGEDRSVDFTRSLAAQLIAVRVLRSMSSHDVIRALTLDFDLPSTSTNEGDSPGPDETERENEALLAVPAFQLGDTEAGTVHHTAHNAPKMCALEVAIVAEALKFIASPIVQELLQDIWKGNIVLWGDLDINASTAQKKATIYTWNRTMWVGYSRLRVPRYRFAFQVANFCVLLVLFLMTLRQNDRDHISVQEIFLDVWFLGFAYAELGQIRDSSLSMYSQDPWSFFDIAMVLIFGMGFEV